MVTISPDRRAAVDRLLELVVVLGEDMERGLRAMGLTGPRAHVLWLLRDGGASTQRGLADALGMSPRGITGLVDGMAAAGLVERTAHPDDRRATLVRLAPDGDRLAGELSAGHDELAEVLFGSLPDDQVAEFVATAGEVSARLYARLSPDGVGGTAAR